MRGLLQRLAGLAASLLLALPAAALVAPEPGSVLPDYDIRNPQAPLSGMTDPDTQAGLPTMLRRGAPSVSPSAAQLGAARALKAAVPGLQVSFRPDTGLPHQVHAYGKALTAPSTGDRATLARQFLRTHRDMFPLTDEEIEALIVARNYSTGRVFHTLWLAQTVNGVMVDQAAIRFNFDNQNRIVWVAVDDVRPGLKAQATASLSPEEAIRRAAEHIGVVLDGNPSLRSHHAESQLVFDRGQFLSEIVVEPTIFPLGPRGGLLAWRVFLEPRGPIAAWYAVTLDAQAGRLLARYNMYKYVTNAGLVFNGNYPEQPGNANYPKGVPQTRQSFGYRWPSTAGWTIPAPYGAYNFTIGNNVEAREDWVGDNEATLGLQPDGGPNQEWLFPFTNAYATSTGTTDAARIADAKKDVDSIVTNLFYWNNLWHDYMHGLGFDEGSGNFQFDNFSRGGCGNDAVRADGMDNASPASGNPSLNNANFATPAEPVSCQGNFRPRMQQYVCRAGPASAPTWLSDTSLDADVIIHEFSHGTSHRLVGGPFLSCLSAFQSGAMGEGWGDWYAASYFDDPVMGEYSFADPVAGVRCYAMDQNPRNYADVCAPWSCGSSLCQVHKDGEVHASILWDMRVRVGKAVAEQLVTDGLKFAPCGPTFVSYRDALLMADQVRYGGVHQCDIWAAYQGRGVGLDADAIQGTYPVADFVFQGTKCSGWAHLRYDYETTDDPSGNGDGLFGPGEVIDLRVALHNRDGASTATSVSATVSTTTAGITMLTATRTYPNIPVNGSAMPSAPFQFRVEPAWACGSPIDFKVDITWGTGLTRSETFTVTSGSRTGVALFKDDAEGTPLALVSPANTSTAQNHTPGGTRSYHMIKDCFVGNDPGCTAPCSNTCSSITLPELVLPAGAQGAEISFWATYNIEWGYDGVWVEASVDGGRTWQYVDTVAYPGTSPGGGCTPGGAGVVNGPSDNSGLVPWTRFAGSLYPFLGTSVRLRIMNAMDQCVEFEGAYVDDIQVNALDCTASTFFDILFQKRTNRDDVAPCTDNDGSPDPGETVNVDVQLINSGNSVANNVTATLTTTNPNVTINPATATQSYGNMSSGQALTRTFQYTVASSGVGCFEDADFDVAVTATGGFNRNIPLSEVLSADPGVNEWFDDFEGGQPAWTASLGPDGTQQDFAIRTVGCTTSGGRFWSTNISMSTTQCASGEPDYSPDSDSMVTSPPIDLGDVGSKITYISWLSSPTTQFATTWGGTVAAPGFTEVQIDHDGDGIFTTIARWVGGLNSVNWATVVDVQNNPAGVPILAKDTARNVQVRLRLRALGPDPSSGRSADGVVVNDFHIQWEPCDNNLCLPGTPAGGRAGRPAAPRTATPAGGLSSTGTATHSGASGSGQEP